MVNVCVGDHPFIQSWGAGNITVLQWIGERTREVCCAVHIGGLCKWAGGMDYALPALALLLSKRRAGKHPQDVIFALFVVLTSIAANYLDGVRLWLPRDVAAVHWEACERRCD